MDVSISWSGNKVFGVFLGWPDARALSNRNDPRRLLYFAGMSWKIIGSFIGGMAITVPILWVFIMEAYQKKRVTQFLDPESDPLGAGYQIIQSLIAIGSGGMRGKGWANATQGQLGFIPESHTDFIFSTYAEEWGFLGCVLLPVMGSPLPFFSYGGTAMITQGICFGIIMSLCLQKPYKH